MQEETLLMENMNSRLLKQFEWQMDGKCIKADTLEKRKAKFIKRIWRRYRWRWFNTIMISKLSIVCALNHCEMGMRNDN
jgi:hypothetical protein